MLYALIVLTCIGGGSAPCKVYRVEQPLSAAECVLRATGRLHGGNQIVTCATEADIDRLQRTKGLTGAAALSAQITERMIAEMKGR